MDKIFNWEQWRIIAVSTVSPLFGYLTPNKRFCLCVGSNVCVQYLGRNEGGCGCGGNSCGCGCGQ